MKCIRSRIKAIHMLLLYKPLNERIEIIAGTFGFVVPTSTGGIIMEIHLRIVFMQIRVKYMCRQVGNVTETKQAVADMWQSNQYHRYYCPLRAFIVFSFFKAKLFRPQACFISFHNGFAFKIITYKGRALSPQLNIQFILQESLR